MLLKSVKVSPDKWIARRLAKLGFGLLIFFYLQSNIGFDFEFHLNLYRKFFSNLFRLDLKRYDPRL